MSDVGKYPLKKHLTHVPSSASTSPPVQEPLLTVGKKKKKKKATSPVLIMQNSVTLSLGGNFTASARTGQILFAVPVSNPVSWSSRCGYTT